MLCIGHARVGVLRRSWWAVWDGERLHEGTRDRFDCRWSGARRSK